MFSFVFSAFLLVAQSDTLTDDVPIEDIPPSREQIEPLRSPPKIQQPAQAPVAQPAQPIAQPAAPVQPPPVQAQPNTQLPVAQPTQDKVTNSGEPFKDPFSNEAPVDSATPAQPSIATPAPALAAPAPTAPAPTISDMPVNEIPAGEPVPTEAPAVPLEAEPLSSPTPGASVAPSTLPPSEAHPMQNEPDFLPPPSPGPQPQKNFEFPVFEEDRGGPVSQEIIRNKQLEESTGAGTWNLAGLFGAGFNLNRRPNQTHFELNGGYRLDPRWEIGGIISYRTLSDTLLGLLVHGKYFWRLTEPPSNRIEISAGGALGYTLRMPKSKFTEGRITLRATGEGLFYVNPRIALIAEAGLESFFFSIGTNGKTVNLMSNGGPPTQFLTLVGVRLEF